MIQVRPVVCIAAAGKGTRAGTPWHKALLPINDKAIISHIIESFDQHVEIVVAVGHQKEVIKGYCNAAYPYRKITYVEVDKYEGTGSGPGYSMNCCRAYLQRPFWFITCDCIASYHDIGLWSSVTSNWLGVYPIENSSNYSTVQMDLDRNVTGFANKSPNGYKFAYIGFCSIKDYAHFWKAFDKYCSSNKDAECEHVGAFYDHTQIPNLLTTVFHTWHDTGTPEGYAEAKEKLGKSQVYHFEKNISEITYQLPAKDNRLQDGSFIVKLNSPDKIAKKLHRAEILKDVVPKCTKYGEYVFSYTMMDGKLFYELDKAGMFLSLVRWCDDHLWSKEQDIPNFQNSCFKFYKSKTDERIALFNKGTLDYCNKEFTICDNPHTSPTTGTTDFSNRVTARMADVIKQIDWNWLCDGIAVPFHGDLNFGNALTDERFPFRNFMLIDWREEFADQPDYGDVYYDLAKLYAGIDVSWMSIAKEKWDHDSWELRKFEDGQWKWNDEFKGTFSKNNIISLYTWTHTTDDLKLFKKVFEQWIVDHGYDLKKVKVIAALIYLNMSPLHNRLMGEYLFILALERLARIYAPVY